MVIALKRLLGINLINLVHPSDEMAAALTLFLDANVFRKVHCYNKKKGNQHETGYTQFQWGAWVYI